MNNLSILQHCWFSAEKNMQPLESLTPTTKDSTTQPKLWSNWGGKWLVKPKFKSSSSSNTCIVPWIMLTNMLENKYQKQKQYSRNWRPDQITNINTPVLILRGESDSHRRGHRCPVRTWVSSWLDESLSDTRESASNGADSWHSTSMCTGVGAQRSCSMLGMTTGQLLTTETDDELSHASPCIPA